MQNKLRSLRLARGLTLEQLADAAGTSHQQILRLEKGERRLTVDWMVRLAPPLGVEPKDLLPESQTAAPPSPAPAQIAPNQDIIPVRSAARGGDEQRMFLEDGPIDYGPRPPVLRNVRDAYAIYVVGESMAPRYRPGYLLHINPFKPPRRENGVVVYKKDNAVLIKEFVEATSTELVLRQFNPAMELRLDRDEIAEFHTVVGTEEA
ncbi:XRE family transcriptional regulator [Lacibacterium aquatile]|uniref:XRE family transcriptional regulator n=1 Tax=Lacibacterium aquatile TaxID=1168082 RepID=A0ABW5DP48_9PROT